MNNSGKLFTNTKAREDRTEYILRRYLPGNLTQVVKGLAQVYSKKIAAGAVGNAGVNLI
jgi:hypothetical protein